MEKTRIKKIVEAVIFSSPSPVSPAGLKSALPELSSEDLGAVFKELAEEWKEMDRGVELVKVSGGYQFRTGKDFAPQITGFNKKIKKLRLSKAALEVLAVSAYQQPLTRADIEEIRGVDSSAVVNLLMERGMLEICGRKDVPGRPFLYKTTDDFLKTFGVDKLSDLPTLKEIEEIEKDLAAPPLVIAPKDAEDSSDGNSEPGDGTENA
ncbi:MAG: SMC-Scp complex subunit ScpB [Candidatus Dadabacteria bacterium]|nr:SMC-Scp complex subunit ScpB [Candidatus Dadabacteria bacterium]